MAKQTSKSKRNTLICDQFVRGMTQTELALEFSVSRTRIWQILSRAHVLHLAPIAVTAAPKVFTAVLLDSADKLAVIKQASLERLSVSSFVAKLIKEGMDRRRAS